MDDGLVTFAPVDQRQLQTSRRLTFILAVLVLVQFSSAFVGISEAMFSDRPTTVAVFVCAGIAVAWVVVAGWAGSRELSIFVWLASIFWTGVVAVIVVAILAAPSAADSVESALQRALLPVLVLAAVPLDPLGQFIPLEDQLTRCLLVALGILVLCLASWLLARARTRRLAASFVPDTLSRRSFSRPLLPRCAHGRAP